MVAITDGGDNASRNSSAQAVQQFLKNGWPTVFGLILDYNYEHTHRGYFKKIVANTGGIAAYPSSASKVVEATNELAAEVYAPFVVTLQASQPISKPAKLDLEVVGADNKPRGDIEVAHIAEVTGCDMSPRTPAKAD